MIIQKGRIGKFPIRPFFDIKNYLGYNSSMKKIIITSFLFFICSSVFAGSTELSRQATAFYSDNNPTKTMDLILQINEKERTSQDWLLLGNVLADKGEAENALYMYQKALEKDKKCYKAYYNIGNYYMDKGQFDKAIENYKKAISIKEDNPYIYYNLGCAYMKLNNYKSAKTNFIKAITIKPAIPEFNYNLAFVYKKLGNDKLAETYMENYNKLKEN